MKISPEGEFWAAVDFWLSEGLDPFEEMEKTIKRAINYELKVGLDMKANFEFYTEKYPLWQFGSEFNSTKTKIFID